MKNTFMFFIMLVWTLPKEQTKNTFPLILRLSNFKNRIKFNLWLLSQIGRIKIYWYGYSQASCTVSEAMSMVQARHLEEIECTHSYCIPVLPDKPLSGVMAYLEDEDNGTEYGFVAAYSRKHARDMLEAYGFNHVMNQPESRSRI